MGQSMKSIEERFWRENHTIRHTHTQTSNPWLLLSMVQGSGLCLMIYKIMGSWRSDYPVLFGSLREYPCPCLVSARQPVFFKIDQTLQGSLDASATHRHISGPTSTNGPSFPITFNHKGPRLTQGLFAERA